MPGWLKPLLLLCAVLPGVTLAQEVIEDFAVELQVRNDGRLDVTERITVQAEGDKIQRGIYRDIPVTYRLPGGLLRKTPIDLLSATRLIMRCRWQPSSVSPGYCSPPLPRLLHGRPQLLHALRVVVAGRRRVLGPTAQPLGQIVRHPRLAQPGAERMPP